MLVSWRLEASVPGSHLGKRLLPHVALALQKCSETTALAEPKGRWEEETTWALGDGLMGEWTIFIGWVSAIRVEVTWLRAQKGRKGGSFKCTASCLAIKSQEEKKVPYLSTWQLQRQCSVLFLKRMLI